MKLESSTRHYYHTSSRSPDDNHSSASNQSTSMDQTASTTTTAIISAASSSSSSSSTLSSSSSSSSSSTSSVHLASLNKFPIGLVCSPTSSNNSNNFGSLFIPQMPSILPATSSWSQSLAAAAKFKSLADNNTSASEGVSAASAAGLDFSRAAAQSWALSRQLNNDSSTSSSKKI